MHRLRAALLLVTLATLALATGVSAHPKPHRLPYAQTIAVPSYFYPGPLWSQMDQASPVVGLAIINPNSGPGATINSDYVTQVQHTQSAGLTILGYVHTSYGARSPVDVTGEVDAYYRWYHVDGIFFDEASTDCLNQPYYAALNTYVKAQGGKAVTVLNPGTQTSECYMAAADIVVTFEGNYNSYVNSYAAPSWVSKYDPKRFWHLIYATPAPLDMALAMLLSKQRGAGWVYVTPDDLPNPWDTLPANPYWQDELALAVL